MIYLIRHGQTELNSRGLMQGRGSNAPLNDKGIMQAETAAEWFRERGISFSRVYSSPLIRAVETARIAAGLDDASSIIPDDRLLEMDYGPYESIDLKQPLPEDLRVFFSDFVHNPAPEGMETLASIVARSGDFLEEIKSYGLKENVLVSTHAIAMKGLIEYLTPESRGGWWSRFIGNCAIFSSEVSEDGALGTATELYNPPREKK